MKGQAYNPFLPLDVYIPDGEPHIFGDRIYLFGSHDKEGGDTFCELDYEFFSAPLDDLNNWSSKGINYSARQDALNYQVENKNKQELSIRFFGKGKFDLYSLNFKEKI